MRAASADASGKNDYPTLTRAGERDAGYRPQARCSILQAAMTDTHIVTTAYRYKRPPKKRKAVAIAGPVIRAEHLTNQSRPLHLPPMTTARPSPAPPAAKSAIVTATSRKRAGRQRNRSPTTPRRTPRCARGSSARNGVGGLEDEQGTK